LDALKYPALAKLTPEKRKKVINLAAEMALLNHIKKLVNESQGKTTSPDSHSNGNQKDI
jgi:hypothetical protein